jgi:ubiquinone biosynthesis protein COQ4
MLNKLKQLYKAFQAYKNSEMGDFALLKFDAIASIYPPEIISELQPLAGYHPRIDLEELSRYPQGTLGREYAEHMKANHIQPLNISPELEEVARRNAFVLRYIVTHDILHVLLGFDTSYAGEMGVLAFNVAQNSSQLLKISFWLARFLYPIFAPWQFKAISANLKKGKAMGKKADFLLSYRFEEHWSEPIDQVRKRLGLPSLSSRILVNV